MNSDDDRPGDDLLHYATPPADGGRRDAVVFGMQLIGGAVVGIGAIFVVGCFGFTSVYPDFMHGDPKPKAWTTVAWSIVGVLAGYAAHALWSRQRRNGFMLGLLLGSGTTCLIEGIWPSRTRRPRCLPYWHGSRGGAGAAPSPKACSSGSCLLAAGMCTAPIVWQ